MSEKSLEKVLDEVKGIVLSVGRTKEGFGFKIGKYHPKIQEDSVFCLHDDRNRIVGDLYCVGKENGVTDFYFCPDRCFNEFIKQGGNGYKFVVSDKVGENEKAKYITPRQFRKESSGVRSRFPMSVSSGVILSGEEDFSDDF